MDEHSINLLLAHTHILNKEWASSFAFGECKHEEFISGIDSKQFKTNLFNKVKSVSNQSKSEIKYKPKVNSVSVSLEELNELFDFFISHSSDELFCTLLNKNVGQLHMWELTQLLYEELDTFISQRFTFESELGEVDTCKERVSILQEITKIVSSFCRRFALELWSKLKDDKLVLNDLIYIYF